MKKYYRISVFENNSVGEHLAALAAKSNGGQYMTIPDLVGAGKGFKATYNALGRDTTIEPIGDSLLHVDAKSGDEYKTVCVIEEVEVMELEGGAAMVD